MEMRIAIARFSHETCTFCPRPTTIEHFEMGGVYQGDEVIQRARGVKGYVRGFINVAEEEGAELVGILDASRSWGGSSGSWLTEECFNKYADGIAEGLRYAGDLDGVFLSLHGAMAARAHHKPEAEVARRARRAVGPEIPIMVTLDLHANEDHELTDATEAVFVIKTYPHVDKEEVGMTAARWMIETVRGERKPTMAIRKPGVISPSVFQGTGIHPGKTIMDRCREWERKHDCYVSVAFGFAYADVPDGGAAVISITNDDHPLAEKIAQDISDLVWELREPLANRRIPNTREGVTRAIRLAKLGNTPIVLADHSDRLGDSTHILKELLLQGAENFGVSSIADPFAVQELKEKHEVGDKVELTFGAYTATRYAGEPITVDGTISFLGDGNYRLTGPKDTGRLTNVGLTAALDLGRNRHVVITSTLHQCQDSEGFKHYNIPFENMDILVIKSRVHFRAFYEGYAKEIIEIDAPGYGPADLTQLTYQNEPPSLYPIDPRFRG
ncbi:MAG: M81 family metallopeptidase [Candidatus Bathyarchaeota archaeon]|jgi:microcystin degradation protein MlrC